MKKKLLTLVFLALLAQANVFAHGVYVTRSWCGGVFHRKFVAEAVTSVLSYTTYNTGYNCIGQLVGYGPFANWTQNCDNTSKGCSRPQVATCSNSGSGNDYIYSGCYLTLGTQYWWNNNITATHGFSGTVTTGTCTGRGSGGLDGTYELDPEIWANLNDHGDAHFDVSGNFQILPNNVLSIEHLKGDLDITKDADYYSSIKLIVFKESNKVTEEEALANENNVLHGNYDGIMYTTSLLVSRAGNSSEGVLSLEDPNLGITSYENTERKGLHIDDLSLSVPLEGELGAGEELTVMFVVDGGFDISTAIVASGNKALSGGIQNKGFEMYPNPSSTNRLNFNLDIQQDKTPVQISCYDITGRLVQDLYAGQLDKGIIKLENLNISSLPSGVFLVKVSIGDAVVTKRLIVE